MIQKIIDILYRYPKSTLLNYQRFGGYMRYRAMMRNRALMQKASSTLPAVTSFNDGLPVYFLTGKNYLYQTLFCIQSLSRHSTVPFRFILVDDGTFDDDITTQITKQLPCAEIISNATIAKNLEKILPAAQYPVLHRKRTEYPHIKKLTDVHSILGNKWKLVLDSDMLFWNEPLDIINWLKNPVRPIHMIDCAESYGYSKQLMAQLAGLQIPELLNVGAIGLNSDAINWQKLENWISILEETEGKSYYLEQALSAMLIGDSPSAVLDAGKYIVNPDDATINGGEGVLHHYVDLSKKEYYNTAWKKLI